jgi:hypothetical protein
MGTSTYVAAGLRTLDWLMDRQTAPNNVFRPVGTAGFHDVRSPPRPFDQQPLEAAATISACLAAFRAGADPKWQVEARRAFAWFLGRNDLSLPLVDVDTGSCRDGLHPGRRNENRGGESAVSYLLGLTQLRALERAATAATQPRPAALRNPANSSAQPSRGRLVTNHLSEPASPLPPT